MRINSNNKNRTHIPIFLFAALIIFCHTFVTVPLNAADKFIPGNIKKSNEKIQITGDTLISNSKEKFAEFRGNVEATQGDFKIRSDVLRIYYKGDLNAKKNKKSGEETLDKLIATGNVKMRFKIWTDSDYAETQKAVYKVDSMVLSLTGKKSKVTSDKNSISGANIVLNLSNGQYKVDGGDGVKGGGGRVKLTFYPESKEKKQKTEPKE